MEEFDSGVMTGVAFTALISLLLALCVTQCDRGGEHARCYGNGTCDTSLVCKSNLCVKP